MEWEYGHINNEREMMNTTINVTENIKLEFTKGTGSSVGTYSPLVFRKGGEVVRNPGTGEMVESKDKWQSVPLYFSNLAHALRWAAQEAADNGQEVDLEDYIKVCERVWRK
jgi:hypothetical protein